LGHGLDYIYKGTTQFIGLNKHDLLTLSARERQIYQTEKIDKLYPEYYIIKVDQFDDIAVSGLQEWIYLLKNGTIKKEFKAKGIKEAEQQLDIMKLSREERLAYEAYMSNQRYENSLTVGNYDAGKAVGEYERAIGIAKKCLAKGMAIAEIAELTGLTEDEVRSLVSE
jgi:predicted transposase/invertase (TIGR01784 family)